MSSAATGDRRTRSRQHSDSTTEESSLDSAIIETRRGRAQQQTSSQTQTQTQTIVDNIKTTRSSNRRKLLNSDESDSNNNTDDQKRTLRSNDNGVSSRKSSRKRRRSSTLLVDIDEAVFMDEQAKTQKKQSTAASDEESSGTNGKQPCLTKPPPQDVPPVPHVDSQQSDNNSLDQPTNSPQELADTTSTTSDSDCGTDIDKKDLDEPEPQVMMLSISIDRKEHDDITEPHQSNSDPAHKSDKHNKTTSAQSPTDNLAIVEEQSPPETFQTNHDEATSEILSRPNGTFAKEETDYQKESSKLASSQSTADLISTTCTTIILRENCQTTVNSVLDEALNKIFPRDHTCRVVTQENPEAMLMASSDTSTTRNVNESFLDAEHNIQSNEKQEREPYESDAQLNRQVPFGSASAKHISSDQDNKVDPENHVDQDKHLNQPQFEIKSTDNHVDKIEHASESELITDAMEDYPKPSKRRKGNPNESAREMSISSIQRRLLREVARVHFPNNTFAAQKKFAGYMTCMSQYLLSSTHQRSPKLANPTTIQPVSFNNCLDPNGGIEIFLDQLLTTRRLRSLHNSLIKSKYLFIFQQCKVACY